MIKVNNKVQWNSTILSTTVKADELQKARMSGRNSFLLFADVYSGGKLFYLYRKRLGGIGYKNLLDFFITKTFFKQRRNE
jgi:hypothetical protein